MYVRCFSDSRIEAIHAQIREAETVQAIARLRLVRAKKLKLVYLLGNLPVDILVDHLVSWEELMGSSVHTKVVAHFQKMRGDQKV